MPDSVNTRFLVRWVGVLLAALLTCALAGCVHTSTIPLADLSQSLDKDIVVTTHDGKTTRYNAGSFEVIMSDSGHVLRTKGSVGDGQAGHRMGRQGSALAFANIKVIETREKTAFYYTGPILVALMAVLLVVWHGAIKQ
jgi:hypothetical protein